MQTNTPSRSRIRLTRRGRLAVVVAGAVVAGTAVAVPLLTLAGGHEQGKPVALVIPEGWRASQVYDAIDKTLKLPAGTTRKSLDKAALRLPSEAGGNPEGYLYPATYQVREGASPESLLRTMVETASRKHNGAPVAAGAQRNAMNVYQTVTIASIVQAEAATKVDMGKVARVVLNRLERGMPLQMDSTINYALNRNTLRTTQDDTQIASPYNSYQRMGLPPTPIDNPGEEAMRAALNPTPGDWLYFVAVRPGDTRFTADYSEHLRNVADFNALHQSAAAQPSGGSPTDPTGSTVPAAPWTAGS
ncbi:endolytic transglycosylase MltG [Streptomyces sp. SID486]|uniref:endolytic transglycosylase MltG n=1 Tax=unclassified Streptomyces TaxID=2593676 RepID=UPI00136B7A42|nr:MULTISPECIES: endolytic transglycosylase MltG [unclassified Streptomyces]MYW43256.1 endolytic transglycosylase MltG [Streptomyces sp. SID161]MYY00202.1 endolytic transglycosylase MltG [Streptomyces sp. SID486]